MRPGGCGAASLPAPRPIEMTPSPPSSPTICRSTRRRHRDHWGARGPGIGRWLDDPRRTQPIIRDQGGFTSRRRRGQWPPSSDWRWNSGGSAAITDERCLVPHLRREPLSRTGSRHADFACLSIDKYENSMTSPECGGSRWHAQADPVHPLPHHNPQRSQTIRNAGAGTIWRACGLDIGQWQLHLRDRLNIIKVTGRDQYPTCYENINRTTSRL
jgi:hypothetical protein